MCVRPFPNAAAGKSLVSKGGGDQPQWRGDGKELYYISADSKMMAVEVSASPVFQKGTPRELFAAAISGAPTPSTHYDVRADGKKFVMLSPVAAANTGTVVSPPITVVLNWQAGLKK